MTTGILLQHPSWTDEHECFKLEDRLSSVCAACYVLLAMTGVHKYTLMDFQDE
jgi:hypothetical protein